MSAERFISELEQRDLLSDRQLAKLRDAASERKMSPKALAKFLVQKNHLTQKQATDALNAVLLGGGDLDAFAPPTTATAGFEADPDLALAPIEEEAADEDESGNDAGTSSIFASYLTKPNDTNSSSPPKPAGEDELILLPDDDDASKQSPAATRGRRDTAPPPEPVKPGRKKSAPDEIEEVSLNAVGADDANSDGLEQVSAAERRTPRVTTSLKRSNGKGKERTKSKPRAKKAKGKWDSPLMLIGGGGLALLLLTGALLYWLLIYESGDQQLAQARAARDSGNYPSAIQEYGDFIAGSPSHPEHDTAVRELILLRIRQATETKTFEQALTLAQTDLKTIEDNKDFEKAYPELAALLPAIAQGLADQTDKAEPGSEEAKKSAELANKALELCDNTIYLPKKFRDEGKLTAVHETLQLVERRNASRHALDDSLAAVNAALASGDTNKAYATYSKLLSTNPELAESAPLAEALKKITAADQAAIKLVNEPKPAETVERPEPWIASLAVANRRIKPDANAAAAAPPNSVACLRLDGAAYAFEVTTGKLLWRRDVGFARPPWPMPVGADVLLADTAHNELLSVEAQSNKLKWRQPIGEPFAQPLIVGDRAFLPADSGKLYVIDLASGNRLGFVQFAQPLRVSPTVDRTNERMYLVGDHSCIYSILLKDMSCLGVYYLGHAEGSVTKSPAAVMDKLAVLENDGVETSRLRLLAIGDNGAVTGQSADRRLTGLASAAPYVAGRRAVVITDRGQIDVYDIGAGKEGEPLTLVATRAAPGATPVVRYAALAERNIWIGDTQLTKFSILPTGNRLPVEAIESTFAGATFDHPLALFGETLIHARRAKGRAGAIVAASDTAKGHTLWETDVAVPPAGEPVVDESSRSLAVANAAGNLFHFDEAAIKSRVQDEPVRAEGAPVDPPSLSAVAELGQGRAAFNGAGSDAVLLYNPTAGAQAARWIKLDGPLACNATSTGSAIIAPLAIGQVFALNAADGSKMATPFQPMLKPSKEWRYTPAGAIEGDPNHFVITDGEDNIYVVGLVEQPQPHLEAQATGKVGPNPISSPIVVLGDTALAVAAKTHLLRFKMPSLESAGEANLPAAVVWGPYRAGNVVILATAKNELMAIAADGKVAWQTPIEHGDLAGAPLVLADSVVLAYRKGMVERRTLADGKPAGAQNVELPLASGPASFLNRLVLATSDGTILVVDAP